MNRILLLPAAALLLLLSGCASAAPASDEPTTTAPPISSPTSTTSAADTVCDELSEPVSLTYNAWNDFQKGTITLEQRNADLAQAATLFRAVDATAVPGVEGAVAGIVTYIDAATPDESGQPYDPGTDEFFDLRSSIGIACEGAGSELVTKAHGG